MSHELLTPLNAIMGFSDLMLDEQAGPITAEQRKQLTLVNQSGKHLRQLIDRILYVSRIDAGRVVYEPDWFDVNETMARVLDAVRPEAHGLELNAQSMQPSVRIFNDEAKLSEVLLNLVENAVKFTKQGKVELCCDCHEGMMEISVRDTGIGIKPQDVPLVFQPFRQLDSSMRRSYGGAGLGLYLSSKLLKLLHGTVRVNSEWGKGSVFTVTVPVEISCN